jgi:hypothetical protein
MAYKLLGMITWKGAKWFLRRKYRSARTPKPLLTAGLLVLLIAAAVLAGAKRPTLHR